MDEIVPSRHQAVKIIAISIFVLLPFVFFYLGFLYQKISTQKTSVKSEPNTFEECVQRKDSIIQQSNPRVCFSKLGSQFLELITPTQQEGLKPLPDSSSIYPGWLTYTNKENKISMQYPPEWRVLENSQLFEQGDLFGLQIIGRTQKLETEIYDGSMVGIAKPLNVPQSAESWAKNYYKESPTGEIPQFSTEVINGISYMKVYTCGLGCFTYYHVKRGDTLYGIVTFSEGPDKAAYDYQINQILSTITFE